MQNKHDTDFIIEQALEISTPHERSNYLAEACGDDPALRQEVESLIAAVIANPDFMESPPEAFFSSELSETVGDTIERYELLKQIGEGGFGNVYLAQQKSPVVRQVALKVIKPGMDSKEVISRFQAERQALALMEHPFIAKVLDAGTTEKGRPYFVMEFVDGVEITKYCRQHELDLKKRLELFIDVCAAVQHAHQKGMIHRDLKPSNILVAHQDNQPLVKVIDFGIAKAIGIGSNSHTIYTRHDRLIGTPQYMSPEQAENPSRGVDTLSDIYSLGIILYELLTGTTPLDGKQLSRVSFTEIQRQIRDLSPQKPSTKIAESIRQHLPAPSSYPGINPQNLRGDLDWIVMKALEKCPSRRYESASSLAEDIVRFLSHQPVNARPPSKAYLIRRFARRHRTAVIAGAALFLTLLIGALGTSIGMQRAIQANQALVKKNHQLDQQTLELIDYKERLAGLLESNQEMLDQIRRIGNNSTLLPDQFDALQKENQALLDKVQNEVAHQERYQQEIDRLESKQAELESSLTKQRQANDEQKRITFEVEKNLASLQQSLFYTLSQNNTPPTDDKKRPAFFPIDQKSGQILVPHSLISLTPDQIDETQTTGTLTLTAEQWKTVLAQAPQSPRRYDTILSLPWTKEASAVQPPYVLELSRQKMAIIHAAAVTQTADDLRELLYQQKIITLRVNERGQFYFQGKLVSYPRLVNALSTPPASPMSDQEEKIVTSDEKNQKQQSPVPWLLVKLPPGADPTADVYDFRLKELAGIADKMGLRHNIPIPRYTK